MRCVSCAAQAELAWACAQMATAATGPWLAAGQVVVQRSGVRLRRVYSLESVCQCVVGVVEEEL
jgi:hypothetical protein